MAARSGLTDLADLSGSKDNVLVKALVTYIDDVASHVPYQRGLLRDRSMGPNDVRPFVVYDPEIRLEKGKVYILNGTDYPYEPREEIQLLLNEGAYVKEIIDTNS